MPVGAALLALNAGGCADIITFAGESREKGITLYNQGSYTDAAGAFNNAIRQKPQDYESHYYLGRTYEAMKQYYQAVQAYGTSLSVLKNALDSPEKEPFRLKVLDGLASACAKGNIPLRPLRNPGDGVGGPPTPEEQFVQAKILRIRGDIDGAIEAYQRVAAADPKSLPVAKEFGLYLAQLGQTQNAAAQLKRAYVLNRRAKNAEDEQIDKALRQLGMIPGPSLVEEKDLAQPLVPLGPLPEVDVSKMRLQNPFVSQPDAPATATPAAGTVGGQPRE